jgi:hypothetical protein
VRVRNGGAQLRSLFTFSTQSAENYRPTGGADENYFLALVEAVDEDDGKDRKEEEEKDKDEDEEVVDTQHGGEDVTGAQHDDDHNVSDRDVDDHKNDDYICLLKLHTCLFAF